MLYNKEHNTVTQGGGQPDEGPVEGRPGGSLEQEGCQGGALKEDLLILERFESEVAAWSGEGEQEEFDLWRDERGATAHAEDSASPVGHEEPMRAGRDVRPRGWHPCGHGIWKRDVAKSERGAAAGPSQPAAAARQAEEPAELQTLEGQPRGPKQEDQILLAMAGKRAGIFNWPEAPQVGGPQQDCSYDSQAPAGTDSSQLSQPGGVPDVDPQIRQALADLWELHCDGVGVRWPEGWHLTAVAKLFK